MTAVDVDTCKHGHPWTPDNTYRTPQGLRQCRACKQAAERRYRRRHVGPPGWLNPAPLLACQGDRTPGEFAADLRVSRATIDAWRSGRRRIPRSRAGRYAAAVGRPAIDLWPELDRG